MSTITWLDQFETTMRSEFAEMIADGRLPDSQVEQMVRFEAEGIASAEFVGGDWCHCGDSVGDDGKSYFRKPGKGTHGWFHDPRKGGCGGITQTG